MTPSTPEKFAELLNWLEDQLEPESAERVARRIAQGDAATQEDLQWLRRFQQAAATVRLAEPPATLRESLDARFATFAAGRRPPGLLAQLRALLTWDSGSQWATAGMRSAATQGRERQMIFSTEGAEIALNLFPSASGSGTDLAGQLFSEGESPDAFVVQLLRDSEEVALAQPDELGEFFIGALPAGDYELVASGATVEILLAPLPIAPEGER